MASLPQVPDTLQGAVPREMFTDPTLPPPFPSALQNSPPEPEDPIILDQGSLVDLIQVAENAQLNQPRADSLPLDPDTEPDAEPCTESPPPHTDNHAGLDADVPLSHIKSIEISQQFISNLRTALLDESGMDPDSVEHM